MSYKKKYLDFVARTRKRVRKIPLGRRRIIVGVSMLVLLTVILSIEISPFGYLVEEGKASPRVIRAPRNVQYVDKEQTKEERDAAAASIKDVYVEDAEITAEVVRDTDDLFDVVSQVADMPITPEQKAQEAAERIKNSALAPHAGALLALDESARRRVRDSVVEALARAMSGGVSSGGLSEAREDATKDVADALADAREEEAAAAIVSAALRPNLVFSKEETERRKQAARDSIRDVVTTKLEGEVIVNKGEVVTGDQLELLKTLGFQRPTFTPLNLLYTAVFVLLLIGALSMFLAKYRRPFYDSPGLLILLGSTMVVFAVLAKVVNVAARSWDPFWGFLIPTAAVAIIIGVLFDSGTALVTVALCALMTGVVTSGNFALVALALLGGFFPALFASRTSNRHQLRRTGLYTAFWVALVAFGVTALLQSRHDLLVNTGIGFLNGAVCTIVALGSLPFLETTFRVTTNTWLLELASPDQELLKDLALQAPGTYSHSVMVANLSEAAAREIGSEAMLARVAAYYHDVGKMKRPQFFVENQPPDVNPHEELSPSLSAIIITAHVKDGVEMLEAEHVPPDIVEIVKEHHGTSHVRFFYEKALEQGDGPVDENRYRYHFPKPRRRTAGILMLADAVEATARTLDNPSASTLEQMVDRIINEKLADGQLDECALTFDELNKVRRVFAKMLIGTYHPRIDYPGTGAARDAGKNNGAGRQSEA